MRIEKIKLRNYRQFRQIDISFQKRQDTDLNYIIGTNGTGKTNLLNAINWCLYSDEPHLSRDSGQQPLLNEKSITRMEKGEDQSVKVDLRVTTDERKVITFCRKSVFRKQANGEMSLQNTTFEVRYLDDQGNSNFAYDEDAEVWVERFVPKDIREFFFFDGERLDNYFKEATRQKIRHAVFQISQIDLLENRVERKLQGTLDDLTKAAAQKSPKIEEARKKLGETQERLNEFNNRVDEAENQIAIAKNKIIEFGEKLTGIPDINVLEKERIQLKNKFDEIKEILKEKVNEKNELVYECANILMLWPSIKKLKEDIEEKIRNQEIPPPVDKSYLSEILESGTCNICGRRLDNESRSRVEKIYKDVALSSETANRLTSMKGSLNRFQELSSDFYEKNRNLTREIDRYEGDLSDIEKEREQLDSKTIGYDEEEIGEWFRERANFEEARDQNQEKLGGLHVMQNAANKAMKNAQIELENELKKEKKVRSLFKKVAFCERSLEVARSTRNQIMEKTRESIEAETKRQFFRLIWKKETFGNITISKDYAINLIHSHGYDCLGSISAGERELLALSFTLALHQASGFDSPILIDTPVARISDVHRENFANVLCEVSTIKPIILLFTPDEYSADISNCIEGRASGRYNLRLTNDEQEAIVEKL